MKLPRPRPTYDSQDEAQTRALIEQADGKTLKQGQTIDLPLNAAIVMTSPNGTRYRLDISDSGVASWTAVV